MAPSSSVLIVGGSRGLGASLISHYASKPSTAVYATTRSSEAPDLPAAANLAWVTNVDLTKPSCGESLASALKNRQIDTVIITAGYFVREFFDEGPKWDEELKMYTTSAIAPVFVVQALVKQNVLARDSKVVLVSSESGSITLRHAGGGDYGHHASKAALNMVGKLLSLDLRDKGVAVAIVHPSFMRTEMTKGVGFDKHWDEGGALTPDEAAKILADWVDDQFSMELTGTYWAPRGTRDIGEWNEVMGEGTQKEGPVQLPW